MNIAAESIVTIYSDMMSSFLVVGLLFMFRHYKVGRDKYADILFSQLCIITLINSVSNAICYALHYQTTGWPEIVRMILPTIAEISVMYVLLLWIMYVDYKMYSSWDRVQELKPYFLMPVLAFSIFGVINLFTGLMFTVDERMLFHAKPMYTAMTVVQYIYGLAAVIAVFKFQKDHGVVKFFYIAPVVVPALAGNLFTVITQYSARSFGFAVALVFLHFSYISRWRFEDVESGFFNMQYLSHLLDLVKDGKKDFNAALSVRADRIDKKLFAIIRKQLPRSGEVIRFGDRKFIIFTGESGNTNNILLAKSIKTSVNEYEEAHEDETPFGLIITGFRREEKENTLDFIKRVEEG